MSTVTALSTYKTFLMDSEDGTAWEKLVDITSYPDTSDEPERIDTTSLSNSTRTYVMGIQDTPDLTFEANYAKATYMRLVSLVGVRRHYAIWFGGEEVAGGLPEPTGEDGKLTFEGQLAISLSGGGVNEARKMSITLTPNTELIFS